VQGLLDASLRRHLHRNRPKALVDTSQQVQLRAIEAQWFVEKAQYSETTEPIHEWYSRPCRVIGHDDASLHQVQSTGLNACTMPSIVLKTKDLPECVGSDADRSGDTQTPSKSNLHSVIAGGVVVDDADGGVSSGKIHDSFSTSTRVLYNGLILPVEPIGAVVLVVRVVVVVTLTGLVDGCLLSDAVGSGVVVGG
jgi:hypothetical protein